MREVAATGDLTRKIALRHGNRWDDEDARLLATTFNTLTDSIARFQREMSQKERLIVARPPVDGHRARDPQPADDHQGGAARAAAGATPTPTVREAAADIDGEVGAAQPARQRSARLRAADPVRARAGRPQRAVPRVGDGGAGLRPGPAIACDLDPRSARSRPTPSGCASRSSTCWSTRATHRTATGATPGRRP